jgi:hypothetical protein
LGDSAAEEAAIAAGRDPEAEKLAEAERKKRRKRKKDAGVSEQNPADSATDAAKKVPCFLSLCCAKRLLSLFR